MDPPLRPLAAARSLDGPRQSLSRIGRRWHLQLWNQKGMRNGEKQLAQNCPQQIPSATFPSSGPLPSPTFLGNLWCIMHQASADLTAGSLPSTQRQARECWPGLYLGGPLCSWNFLPHTCSLFSDAIPFPLHQHLSLTSTVPRFPHEVSSAFCLLIPLSTNSALLNFITPHPRSTI